MLDCKEFYNLLKESNIEFFTGVPDSLLKDFLSYIDDHSSDEHHIIAANEGGAVALASGYFLATKKYGLVYMQNSGLGNAINPLLSLNDPLVYSIPVLLFIGWRGEPGVKDEPQHIKQGKITENLLKTMDIPYSILPDNIDKARKVILTANKYLVNNSAPYALLVKKGTFKSYQSSHQKASDYPLSREDAIKTIIDNIGHEDIIVSTTGKTSREVYEYRQATHNSGQQDFLTIGSMGHASQIALSIARSKPQRKVFCLDGDGSLLMHMGSLAIIGSLKLNNFHHIVLNNGCHDSVGGQPTVGTTLDFAKVAQACGYHNTCRAQTNDEIKKFLSQIQKNQVSSFLEIKLNKDARKDIGRPKTSPVENKKQFMEFLS